MARKRSVSLSFALEGADGAHLQTLLHDVCIGARECPKGISRAVCKDGSVVLSIGPSAFTLRDGLLTVGDAAPVGSRNVALLDGWQGVLVARYCSDTLMLELKKRKPSKARAKKGPSKVSHMFPDAALYVTKKVRPRIVGGGLPSLGKS